MGEGRRCTHGHPAATRPIRKPITYRGGRTPVTELRRCVGTLPRNRSRADRPGGVYQDAASPGFSSKVAAAIPISTLPCCAPRFTRHPGSTRSRQTQFRRRGRGDRRLRRGDPPVRARKNATTSRGALATSSRISPRPRGLHGRHRLDPDTSCPSPRAAFAAPLAIGTAPSRLHRVIRYRPKNAAAIGPRHGPGRPPMIISAPSRTCPRTTVGPARCPRSSYRGGVQGGPRPCERDCSISTRRSAGAGLCSGHFTPRMAYLTLGRFPRVLTISPLRSGWFPTGPAALPTRRAYQSLREYASATADLRAGSSLKAATRKN